MPFGHYIVLANKPGEAMRLITSTEYWAEAINVALAAEKSRGGAEGMVIVARVMMERSNAV